MKFHGATVPPYYGLLYEAYAASEALDRFDLKSDDPASSRRWVTLLKVHAKAQAALIEHVVKNATDLLLECELLVSPPKLPDLYAVARRIAHQHGFSWTDPRTGKTYPAPRRKSKNAKTKRR